MRLIKNLFLIIILFCLSVGQVFAQCTGSGADQVRNYNCVTEFVPNVGMQSRCNLNTSSFGGSCSNANGICVRVGYVDQHSCSVIPNGGGCNISGTGYQTATSAGCNWVVSTPPRPTIRPQPTAYYPTRPPQPTAMPGQPSPTPYPTYPPGPPPANTPVPSRGICETNPGDPRCTTGSQSTCVGRIVTNCSWSSRSQCSSFAGSPSCDGDDARCWCCTTAMDCAKCPCGNPPPIPTVAPAQCDGITYKFEDIMLSTYSYSVGQYTEVYMCRDGAVSNRGWNWVRLRYRYSANGDFGSSVWQDMPVQNTSGAGFSGCSSGFVGGFTPTQVGYYEIAPWVEDDPSYNGIHLKCNSTTQVSVNPCTVQGYKVEYPNSNPWTPAPPSLVANAPVTIDADNVLTSNPYSAVLSGNNEHLVRLDPNPPEGYSKVGYSLCYNDTTCHSRPENITWKNATLLIPNSCVGGYADLWWHFCPKVSKPTGLYPDGSNNGIISGQEAVNMHDNPIFSWDYDEHASLYKITIDDTTNSYPFDCLTLNPGDKCDYFYPNSYLGSKNYYNAGADIGFTPEYGKFYNFFVHAQNSCDVDYTGGEESVAFCLENENCTVSCGQAKSCKNGTETLYCGATDAVAPGQVTISSPNGTALSPTVVSAGNLTLEWQNNETNHDKTSAYRILIYDPGIFYINGAIDPNSNSYTFSPLTFAPGTTYRWTIEAVNSACSTYGGDVVGPTSEGYFKVNSPPVANPNVEIKEFDNTPIVADASSRNHVCESEFSTATQSVKRNKFVYSVTDADSVDEITTTSLRFRGITSGQFPFTLTATKNGGGGWDFSKSGSESGGITIVIANSGVVNTGSELQVTFAIEYNVSVLSPEIYGIEVNGEDPFNSGDWVTATRTIKVWDCIVPVEGTVYEATTGVANCATGLGFSNPYGRNDFKALKYVPSGAFTSDKNMTILSSVAGTYVSGVQPLVWGTSYKPEFTIDGILLTNTARATQIGSGSSVCIPNAESVSLLANSTFFDPYANNISLRVEFSIRKNFDGWWQVSNGATLSNNSTLDSISPLCGRLSDLCHPSIGVTTVPAFEGVVVANGINSNNACGSYCKDGAPNWYIDNKNYLRNPVYYDDLLARVSGEKGYGKVLTPAPGQKYLFSQLLTQNGTGGNIFFVDGVLDIDTNNSLASDQYLFVVAKDIEVRIGVTNIEGVFMALDTRSSGRRANFSALDSTRDTNGNPLQPVTSQLVIKGIVYANGDVRFLRTINSEDGVNITTLAKQWNNSNPAVKIIYDPKTMFLFPVTFNSAKASWRTR